MSGARDRLARSALIGLAEGTGVAGTTAGKHVVARINDEPTGGSPTAGIRLRDTRIRTGVADLSLGAGPAF